MKLLLPILLALALAAAAQEPGTISPSRPVPVGKAPGMKWQLLKSAPDEKVYEITFLKGG